MDETEEYKKCYKLQQTLVELGNLIWDNSWSWTVIKQDVDFSVEKDGLFEVGVSTFVNITVLSNRLERQNVGYCYLSHMDRGTAYSLVRKMSVLNALKETMCSFGGVISDKVLMALQTNNCTIGLPSDHSTKTETRESRNENRNPQTKPCEPTKPKSPGKINRFPSKTFNDNPSAQNNISGNFSSSKPINQVNLPGIDRSNPNVRLPNSNNVQFVSKTPVNTKPSLVVHPKVPLQQMPSNVIAPITNDNPKPLLNQAKTKVSEDELREERKRKQREQQELFRKQMESKTLLTAGNASSEISTQEMIAAADHALKYRTDGSNESRKRSNICSDGDQPKKRV
ncbi:uncharacterized protein LOC113363189 isoform X2 [Ctenocephalides felis]|uniref:uncharacterized protein LOC113363189 isoform X2 n=1 Tax=Ctenocephalides felis TaxID=7515 RepID=UPI000E6E56E0|nr:uncharacterized protein LOC113363189 isoform X2 [Ctenocephalides felis]